MHIHIYICIYIYIYISCSQFRPFAVKAPRPTPDASRLILWQDLPKSLLALRRLQVSISPVNLRALKPKAFATSVNLEPSSQYTSRRSRLEDDCWKADRDLLRGAWNSWAMAAMMSTSRMRRSARLSSSCWMTWDLFWSFILQSGHVRATLRVDHRLIP